MESGFGFCLGFTLDAGCISCPGFLLGVVGWALSRVSGPAEQLVEASRSAAGLGVDCGTRLRLLTDLHWRGLRTEIKRPGQPAEAR